MSWVVLFKVLHCSVSMRCLRAFGENVLPAYHAATQSEPIGCLSFLAVVVLGSFRAYDVCPIEESIAWWVKRCPVHAHEDILPERTSGEFDEMECSMLAHVNALPCLGWGSGELSLAILASGKR